MFDPPKDDVEKSERLWATLKAVEDNPNHWNQDNWHCGTSHCFAGFAELIATELQPENTHDDIIERIVAQSDAIGDCVFMTRLNAQWWLGISDGHRRALFSGTNSLETLQLMVATIAPHSREELAAMNVLPPVEEKKRRIGVKEVCYALAASLLLAFFAL
jgi:hypothetical protein